MAVHELLLSNYSPYIAARSFPALPPPFLPPPKKKEKKKKKKTQPLRRLNSSRLKDAVRWCSKWWVWGWSGRICKQRYCTVLKARQKNCLHAPRNVKEMCGKRKRNVTRFSCTPSPRISDLLLLCPNFIPKPARSQPARRLARNHLIGLYKLYLFVV